jgi:hypothetical protein
MAYKKTTNYALETPETGDAPSFCGDMAKLAEGVDATFVGYAEGTAAARPTAKIKGRIYYATDTKVYSVDTGSEWAELLTVNSGKYTSKSYTHAEAEAGVTPSASHSAIVNISIGFNEKVRSRAEFSVGGVSVGGVQFGATLEAGVSAIIQIPFTVMTNPGEVWKLEGNEGLSPALEAHTRLM